MWTNTGTSRPAFAIEPGPAQESVWDYPRPPALQKDPRQVVVADSDAVIASTHAAYRVLETASPPTFYLPDRDVDVSMLINVPGSSFCEWKGVAEYWALRRDPSTPIAWSYPDPSRRFAAIKDFLGFYPGRVQCTVDGEAVRPQAGGFYGGWITSEIVGPFKGDPGTGHW